MAPTKDELLEQAADAEIEGRSSMTKAELSEALEAKEAEAAPAQEGPTGVIRTSDRPAVSSTGSPTGPVPSVFPTAPANVAERDSRFGPAPILNPPD